MASLRELQREFAAALRDPAQPCAVSPPANLAIYRHNAEAHFQRALAISYPVLRRRVGDDYFRQLAFHYRLAHPSASGDLHWAGREFAAYLARTLAEGDYAWLADLARLEWACEQALVAEVRPAVGAEVLGRFAQPELEGLVFELQPSLAFVESAFPVFSIWEANQAENAPPVNQSLGSERGLVLNRDDGLRVLTLSSTHFACLTALAGGSTLGQAVTLAGLDEAALLGALQLLFGEGLVCSVR